MDDLRLKVESFGGSLPKISQFLENALGEWITKIVTTLEHYIEIMEENNKLMAVMKDRVDHLNRRAGERDTKITRALRDVNSLDQTQGYDINQLKFKVAELEKKCAACNCAHEDPAPKKSSKKK